MIAPHTSCPHITLVVHEALLVEGEVELVHQHGDELDGILQAHYHALGVDDVGEPRVVLDLICLGDFDADAWFGVGLARSKERSHHQHVL